MPRPALAILRAQQETPAPIRADTAGAAAVITLTPAMRRMILAEHEHGDLFHGLDTKQKRAAGTQTRAALVKRGLLDFTGKPTAAALDAARA